MQNAEPSPDHVLCSGFWSFTFGSASHLPRSHRSRYRYTSSYAQHSDEHLAILSGCLYLDWAAATNGTIINVTAEEHGKLILPMVLQYLTPPVGQLVINFHFEILILTHFSFTFGSGFRSSVSEPFQQRSCHRRIRASFHPLQCWLF